MGAVLTVALRGDRTAAALWTSLNAGWSSARHHAGQHFISRGDPAHHHQTVLNLQ
jgi:hypothetical protein